MKDLVIVYTSSTCHNCKEIKELLTEKGYAIEERNVSNKLYRMELLTMGIGSVPVLMHRGRTIKQTDDISIKDYVESLE